mmetsp:Transcript_4434/g.17450  ORF Transcript_4434/g.17450 Transcript_4434/m.17450 type:complete len:296 (-) Transcript_4434:345-1232(-)
MRAGARAYLSVGNVALDDTFVNKVRQDALDLLRLAVAVHPPERGLAITESHPRVLGAVSGSLLQVPEERPVAKLSSSLQDQKVPLPNEQLLVVGQRLLEQAQVPRPYPAADSLEMRESVLVQQSICGHPTQENAHRHKVRQDSSLVAHRVLMAALKGTPEVALRFLELIFKDEEPPTVIVVGDDVSLDLLHPLQGRGALQGVHQRLREGDVAHSRVHLKELGGDAEQHRLSCAAPVLQHICEAVLERVLRLAKALESLSARIRTRSGEIQVARQHLQRRQQEGDEIRVLGALEGL